MSAPQPLDSFYLSLGHPTGSAHLNTVMEEGRARDVNTGD
jgi:hypothetical protein